MCEITVIMPVYNGEKYLAEAINSVLNQTFTDFTLLVLNDNSTDSTAKILEGFKKQDSRVQVITKETNVGPANLRNEGIEKANTKFIALLDADDIALPTRFEKQLKVLKENPEIGVCGTWFTIFGDKKEKTLKHAINHDDLKVQFLKSCGIGNPTVMFKKAVLGDLKFEHKYVPAEDYGLWSQLIAQTKFHNIPESLLKYRWHTNNISQTKIENLRKSNFLIRVKQLEHIGIKATDEKIKYYVNAVALKKKQCIEDVITTIEAANHIKNNNKKYNYYKQDILENHIDTVIIRTIRNAAHYNLSFYNYLKKESGYFSKISLIDKTLICLKSFFKI